MPVSSAEDHGEVDNGVRQYQYVPLSEGEMRLILLEPGEFGTPLAAQIRPGRLSDIEALPVTDRYEAISYAWGSSDKPHRILVEGSYLAITHSLFQALQRFRFQDGTRCVWADAVCINQADTTAKSEQVMLMGSIYEIAARVIVWLGEPEMYDWLAFAWIHAYRLAIDEMRENPDHYAMRGTVQCRRQCSCCPATSFDANDEKAVLEAAILGLTSVLSKPWFIRLWVVQEVALAKVVVFHSGIHSADLRSFLTPITSTVFADEGLDVAFIDNADAAVTGPLKEACSSLVRLFDIFTAFPDRCLSDDPYLTTLFGLEGRLCSDPRDRIFAVRHLSRVGRWPELYPDYTKTSLEIFTQLVKLCLSEVYTQQYEDVSIHPSALLSLAARAPDVAESADVWPSWVPDIHCLDEQMMICKASTYACFPKTWSGQGPDYHVWPFWTYRMVHQFAPTNNQHLVLSIQGRIFGQVVDVHPKSELQNVPGCQFRKDFSSAFGHAVVNDVQAFTAWALSCGKFIRDHQPNRPSEQGDAHQGFFHDKSHAFVECLRSCDSESACTAAIAMVSKTLDSSLKMRTPASLMTIIGPERRLAAMSVNGQVHPYRMGAGTYLRW